MASGVIRLDYSPIRDPPPPGIYFTKAAFEKYSCQCQPHLEQEDNGLPRGDRSLERNFPVSAAVGAESNDGGSAEVSDGAETSPECNGGGSADVPDEADNPPEITSEDLWGSESGSEGDVGDNATEHAPNSAATDTQPTVVHNGQDDSAPPKRGRPSQQEPGKATEASDRTGRGRTKAPAQGTAVAAPEPLSDAAAANAEIMRAFGGLGRKRGSAALSGGASAVRAAGDVLGQQQSAVKSAAAAKDGSMCDLLNPNNPLYDPAFALEYAQIRDAAGKAEGKGFKKKGPRQIWSKLSARDHAWYLHNQGRALQGKEAERLAELARRIADEQQLFLKTMWTVPADAALTYNYMDPRADAQLKGHMAAKREAVRQLPRLWCLKRLLGLAEVTPQKTEPAMIHLGTAHTSGTPAKFTPPPGNLHINLDHPYLRKAPENSSADVPGSVGQASSPKQALHEDDRAMCLAAEKRAAAVISASTFSALARTFPPALSAGWEIPVDVVALSPDPRSCEQGGPGVGSAPRSIACFGKPLVTRELSRRAQMELLFRHALGAHGRDPGLATPPSREQKGSWRQSLLQQLSQEMGTGASQDGAAGHSAGLNTGAEQTVAALSGDIEAMSVGGLSADLEAELAADTSDGSPRNADAERPEQPMEEAGRHSSVKSKDVPSQVRYDLWRLGPFRIISRASVRASHAVEGAYAVPLTVAAKMEYHGDKAEDAEELTAEELSQWWSRAFMRPGSSLLLGHVSVRNSKLLRTESYTARSLQSSAAAAGFSPAFLWRLLQELLRMLCTLRAGRYLLTHAPGSSRICIFAALPDDPDTEQADAPPLPCDTGASAAGAVYDLWAAHTSSGAADEHQVPFVPKRWRPSHADVSQIPYTFALKAPAAAGGGGRGQGRSEGRDGSGGDGGGREGGRKRQRHRKLMPSAWTVGQRPDWDDVPQAAAAGTGAEGRGKGFSAADYAQLLSEDLA
ncbi:hypothetical protein WJX75_006859 [Coccomyxa subellipsoidea]|uniref:Little elongation complex subunit 2 C-terminal domain-containing protein n=1 Tax=Coccomyxa subellipsoidea TaxID=248742 RepID=A0ABR2YCD8_9CHLO